MPPKQRQIKMESKSALSAMQKLETRSDEELEAETRFRAAAQAILGARAAERMDAKRSLGQTPPTNRQLLALRFMGLVAPPPGAPLWLRARGILLIVFLVVALLALGWAIVQVVSLPFGGVGKGVGIFWGFLLVCVVLGVLFLFGRRRQKKARDKQAEARAQAATSGRRR
jgi:hypothetical protein